MTLSSDLLAAAQQAAALENEVAALKQQLVDLQSQSVPLSKRWGFSPTSRMLLWPKSLAELQRDLDMLAATGARWVRCDLDWKSIEATKGMFNWVPFDQLVNEATARGIHVLAVPAYTPAWARLTGTTDKAPPTNLADYVTFVKAAVTRYLPKGVRCWEVWNEPNIVQFWQPKPDPVKYTALLKQTYTAIKAIDPGATVVSGGLAPAGDSSDGNYVSPRTFLAKLYANGVKGSFDALGMHPYAYNYGIDAAGDWNQWFSMPKTYQILVDNGEGAKKIWATEYGAPTGGTSTQAVTEDAQAQYVSDAWREWTAASYAGPLFWYALRDTGTDKTDREQNFGLVRLDFTPKPAYGVFSQLGVAR